MEIESIAVPYLNGSSSYLNSSVAFFPINFLPSLENTASPDFILKLAFESLPSPSMKSILFLSLETFSFLFLGCRPLYMINASHSLDTGGFCSTTQSAVLNIVFLILFCFVCALFSTSTVTVWFPLVKGNLTVCGVSDPKCSKVVLPPTNEDPEKYPP